MVLLTKPNLLFYRSCRDCFKNVRRFSSVTQATYITIKHSKFLFPSRPFLPVLGLNYFENYVWRVINACYSAKSSEDVPNTLQSLVEYENVTEKTLESLQDRFEELLQDSKFEDFDVNYSNGVLTVVIEKNYTYVINKQTPNRQIWLSSPVRFFLQKSVPNAFTCGLAMDKSGPKRYDYIDGTWIYKHDGVSLGELLTKEISDKLKKEANFTI